MQTWDFFVTVELSNDSWEVVPQSTVSSLDVDRLEQLVRTPETEHTDLEVAIALIRLAHDELQEYGTSKNNRVTDEGVVLLLKCLRAVLQRLGVPFDPPFRDFDSFHKHWMRNGASGSWQARRDMLSEQFDPLRRLLDDREAGSLQSTLVDPVSPRKALGWPGVDEELLELRRHFESAHSEQDYSNVGNDAVAVLEALSRTVYNHARHGTPGILEPPIGNTKERLSRFIETSLPGRENSALRKLARAAIEAAQETKHRRTGDRRSAGITADAVILIANILRRIDPSQD